MKKISDFILQWSQKQLGTAKLEEKSITKIIKGVYSRTLSSIAMSSLPLPPSFRITLQRLRGVTIGEHVFMGMGCWLDSVRPDLITIEDYVSLAGRVVILTHSDPTQPIREIWSDQNQIFGPVIIRRGAWIAVNAIILPGITIGENSIVAAGSVVTKDIPSNVIAGGIPAKIIKGIYK
jgi:acetyltransferase-like isoleucine patch superfamily enzyme